jgi:hypothetical protein
VRFMQPSLSERQLHSGLSLMTTAILPSSFLGIVFSIVAELQQTSRAPTHLYVGKVLPNMGCLLIDCSSVASS